MDIKYACSANACNSIADLRIAAQQIVYPGRAHQIGVEPVQYNEGMFVNSAQN